MVEENKSGSDEAESPLKRLREEAGFSQEALARMINVSVTT
ncbi:MAG TPA: XRE family transcriptional regulator, partial [Cyanobacteria bacterium UBA11162]|nr:XRE family transcriptional regulator [Cyanobacteria bacterium UBA11162]